MLKIILKLLPFSHFLYIKFIFVPHKSIRGSIMVSSSHISLFFPLPGRGGTKIFEEVIEHLHMALKVTNPFFKN